MQSSLPPAALPILPLCGPAAHLQTSLLLTGCVCEPGVFDCKPLPLLWRRYPEVYKPTNTVMLDDLRRNYVFNKQQGLVIRPYKHAARNRATDTELLRLKAYLLKIAPLSDFSGLRHSRWERYQG